MAEDTRAIAQSVKTSDSQTKHPCPTGQHNLYNITLVLQDSTIYTNITLVLQDSTIHTNITLVL